MNERVRIRLVKDGKTLGINGLSQDGILLNNETDAWPRGFTLRFGGDNPITRYRMNRVCTVEGWDLGKFKLNLIVRDGVLVVEGVKLDTFPAGTYWFDLQIADLKTPKNRWTVSVPESKEVPYDLKVSEDPRQVELAQPVSSFDGEMKRVLTDAGSRLDGLQADHWLTHASPRARRKACLLNILAMLRATAAPSGSLIETVERVFFADVDRIYAKVQPSFLDHLEALAKDSKKPFYDEGTPKSGTHFKLLDRIKDLEPSVEGYELKSFRGEGKPSLQASVAFPPAGDGQRKFYVDLDLDLGNPKQDALGFFIHFGELLNPGKTDHLKLFEKLSSKKKIKPYLYYVIEG